MCRSHKRTVDLKLFPRLDITITFAGIVEGWYAGDATKEWTWVFC
jgi:hypothetical protein